MTVVTNGGSEEYLKGMLKFWSDTKNEAVPEFKEERVKYEDGQPVIPWGQATALMQKQMAVMARLHGGR